MPKTVSLQSSFNAGVLDPRLASRTDVDKYYAGVATGKNVLCTPQGGFKRRPGMEFVADVGADGRLAAFAFNVEQTYLFVFRHYQCDVYKDDVLQATIGTPWALTDLDQLRWTQSADTMILVHPDVSPRSIVRGAAHTSWTISTISLTNIPQFDFNDASSPTPVSEVQRIGFTGTHGALFTLTLGGQTTANIFYSSTVATTQANIQAALRALSNTSATGITVAHVSGTTFDVTFGGDDSGVDWDIMGFTLVSGTLSAAISEQTKGSGNDEDSWSATRGWPVSVCFHQGRLVFGGSKSRPATIWGSVTNDFYNFDFGAGLADEAIGLTLDTDQVNAISAVMSTRHLQIFTSGGEFVETSSPWTPDNAGVKRQTQYGSNDLQPIAIDGASLFVERRGKVVREYLFQFAEDAYTASAISLLAASLITSPVDMSARKGTADDDANYVYVVNSDGTMAVLNTLRAENVAGWTEWVTAGTILSVAVVVDEIYFLVQRTINSVTEYYLEKANEDTYTDACLSKAQAASTTVTGLSHLDGESCRVKADGAVMADATPSGGSITLARDGEDVEIGLNFDVEITTMPLNVNFANGPTLMREKRIIHAQLDLYETNGIVIGNKRIPDRDLAGALPDVPDPYTGMKEVWPNLGWDHLADITIEQPDPLPMMIRSLSLEVEVSG